MPLLPRIFFLRSRREQLAALQNEVHLSLRIVDQIAAHYELDGGRHSIATMLQEFRDGLVDSPVPDKRDIIKLLVERIVVDCSGEFDIQTRVPLYIPPWPGSVVPFANAARDDRGMLNG